MSKWVMHKKTLYQHAIKMSIAEAAYTKRFGYKKVFWDREVVIHF
jgi:hypothetical protein